MKYVSLTLLAAFCVKSLVQSVDWPNVAIVGVLVALSFIYERVSAQDRYDELKKENKAIREQAEVAAKELKEIKDSIGALKVTVGMKR